MGDDRCGGAMECPLNSRPSGFVVGSQRSVLTKYTLLPVGVVVAIVLAVITAMGALSQERDRVLLLEAQMQRTRDDIAEQKQVINDVRRSQGEQGRLLLEIQADLRTLVGHKRTDTGTGH